ncbi:MAG: ornithine carbamoyltransferase [Candidatus Acidiferrum sp.]
MRHFLDLIDLSANELTHLLDGAAAMKAEAVGGKRPSLLAGRVLGLVFEKPSLRTRVSFEASMAQLGGSSIFLSAADGPIGQRESVPDFARVLSQYVDIAVLRVFRHRTVVEFAAHSSVPVINGLSDFAHPCQALGDLLTMREEFASLAGRTVAFVGDGNNVARSVALGCGKLGAKFILSAPLGYGFDDEFLKEFHRQVPKNLLEQITDPVRAVANADVIYTDVWTSMGQESEREQRAQHFKYYQVNAALLSRAPAHAKVMHCLPAHRGEEISAPVMDGPRSIVFAQAGNRMHAQKALLTWLLP